MGYYSEVAIKAEEKAYNRLRDVFTQEALFVAPDKVMKLSENNEDGVYIISWNYIKWYSHYKGIQKIEAILDDLDREHLYGSNDQLSYVFLRLGEDNTDIEERGNDELELTMYRSIELPELPEIDFKKAV